MIRMALSPAAAGLLRSLLRKTGMNRDRILLTEFRSTDWQSLTFIGEQHRLSLRITGPDSWEIAAGLTDGLEDHEFTIAGHVVADIAVVHGPDRGEDGSVALEIEALTVEE